MTYATKLELSSEILCLFCMAGTLVCPAAKVTVGDFAQRKSESEVAASLGCDYTVEPLD